MHYKVLVIGDNVEELIAPYGPDITKTPEGYVDLKVTYNNKYVGLNINNTDIGTIEGGWFIFKFGERFLIEDTSDIIHRYTQAANVLVIDKDGIVIACKEVIPTNRQLIWNWYTRDSKNTSVLPSTNGKFVSQILGNQLDHNMLVDSVIRKPIDNALYWFPGTSPNVLKGGIVDRETYDALASCSFYYIITSKGNLYPIKKHLTDEVISDESISVVYNQLMSIIHSINPDDKLTVLNMHL